MDLYDSVEIWYTFGRACNLRSHDLCLSGQFLNGHWNMFRQVDLFERLNILRTGIDYDKLRFRHLFLQFSRLLRTRNLLGMPRLHKHPTPEVGSRAGYLYTHACFADSS